MIISIDAELVFDNTQYIFVIMNLSQLEDNYFNEIKYFLKPTANITVCGEI